GNRWIVAAEQGGKVLRAVVFSYELGKDDKTATLIENRITFPNSVCAIATKLVEAKGRLESRSEAIQSSTGKRMRVTDHVDCEVLKMKVTGCRGGRGETTSRYAGYGKVTFRIARELAPPTVLMGLAL